MPEETRITPKPNGPLVVQGPVKIVTPDGRELPVPPRKDGRPAEVVVLCRCGGSATNRFVTELTSATASATPPQRASLPRFKQGVLCCHRPGRGGPGGGGRGA